ncbi:MAG: 30S ribosome-binding factor RbfA [Salinisphaera sp.]|nr:30S ribosome-binding factor RbfA [Salinisphaera sp.]MDN5938048.1 30S ribosome-binding factor RbfA [Salinisphaera sp.]
MPNEFPRSDRVAEQLQRELSSLIATEVKDPRAALAVVTGVVVSRNLAHARVYVAAADLAADSQATVRGLHHAAGFLRARLGKTLHMRYVPRLRFLEDRTERDAAHMDQLIEQARDQDRRHHPDEENGPT